MSNNDSKVTEQEALLLHSSGRPGKLEITATKPLTTQRDLALAYSPGVAHPCLHIQRDPDTAYDYTAKSNIVAVISNGTAVLGLGNIGALASKPVMEGKAVLFKRFADIDGIDLELETEDPEEFIQAVKLVANSFGGINLEDIKAPEAFVIEQRLKEELSIPIMHDDQHGTAIIAAAGLLNALELTGRTFADTKLVMNGAGAASIATAELVKNLGMPHDNVIMCDSKGVIYQGRTEGMNQWKSAHAAKTEDRTLAEALKGADVFFGLSVKDAVNEEMVASMADRPIIFAMANPDPEILPEVVKSVRDDAIIATGRSDYPNQVNNVLGFPYIFRGALDVRATCINDHMKIAAVKAIAHMAREDVPDEVGVAYGRSLRYGPDYIIPAPFDPRLIVEVPKAVAQAAMDSGVARKPIVDMERYEHQLASRLDPTISSMQRIFNRLRQESPRVVFAEGEEEKVIRSALAYQSAGLGNPILVGREEKIRQRAAGLGLEIGTLTIANAKLWQNKNPAYIDYLYQRLQRKGHLHRDCVRMVSRDRNIYAALMVALGDADVMISGTTRSFRVTYNEIRLVLDPLPNERIFGYSLFTHRDGAVIMSDTTVHESPSAEQLANIAEQSAAIAKRMGLEPRVAFLAYSTFGQPMSVPTKTARDAVKILDDRMTDFEYEGEMQAHLALDFEAMKALHPFSRLTGPANVLVMPSLNAANISTKLLQKFSAGSLIGPILHGLEKPAQIVQMNSSVTDIVNTAAMAAYAGIGR